MLEFKSGARRNEGMCFAEIGKYVLAVQELQFIAKYEGANVINKFYSDVTLKQSNVIGSN